METTFVTAEDFKGRLAALLCGASLQGLPRKQLDRHILLKAIVLGLNRSRTYSEREINDALRTQILDVWGASGTDHVTLRRLLVDAGHLTRESDGSSYRVASGPSEPRFEAEVDRVAVADIIQEGRELAARRKRERGA